MATLILLALVILLLSALLIVLLRRERVRPEEVESLVSRIWMESGIGEKVGELATHAKEIKESHRSIERMLRVPTERGAFGEMALETILSDQLPPDMFGMREKILGDRIPDAYIRSTVGIICIDSKFPLDNYRKMIESEDLKEKYKKDFLRDVEVHLQSIAGKYICPEKGTANFAFAYIPSEGVYWFLVNEAFDLLRDYTRKGVQVVSPLTLSHKVELIKAGVHAKKLSENAEKVRNSITGLSKIFEEIDDKWRIFYQTHLRNLGNKAEEIDRAYRRLREEFEKIEKFAEE